MDVAKLQRGEYIAIAGGALLLAGLFLPWYTTKLGRINGVAGPQSGWEVHPILRYVLLVAAVAPLVLAYIILRDHALSWPRGELTAVIAIACVGLLLYNGLIAQPGTSNDLTSLRLGWVVAVLGTLFMLFGAALRSSTSERKRKPPGTL